MDLKAFLIGVAYEGAIAVCGPLIQDPTNPSADLPIDPLIQNVGLQKKALLVYQEAKIQYAAILAAYKDKTGVWPDPPQPAASASTPEAAIGQLLGASPPGSPLAVATQGVLDVLKGGKPLALAASPPTEVALPGSEMAGRPVMKRFRRPATAPGARASQPNEPG